MIRRALSDIIDTDDLRLLLLFGLVLAGIIVLAAALGLAFAVFEAMSRVA